MASVSSALTHWLFKSVLFNFHGIDLSKFSNLILSVIIIYPMTLIALNLPTCFTVHQMVRPEGYSMQSQKERVPRGCCRGLNVTFTCSVEWPISSVSLWT